MLPPLTAVCNRLSVVAALRARLVFRRTYTGVSHFSVGNAHREKEGVEVLPDVTPPPQTGGRKDAYLYISSVFPVRVAGWDLRHFVGVLRKEELLDHIEALLGDHHIHGFKLLSLDPTSKDGGAFVHFEYDSSLTPSSSTAPSLSDSLILREIVTSLRDSVEKKGGIPTWKGFGRGEVWLVHGKPWREDLNRFPTPMLKVEFDGPDVDQESLYDVFRTYGRIQDIYPPSPVPAGTLRSSVVNFGRLYSAPIARNCLHGLAIAPHAHDTGAITAAPDGKLTRITLSYERQIKPHLIRDWLSSHPRIVLPAVAFLLATVTYTIFDPIRAFFVEAKVLGWLDYHEYTAFQWLRRNTIERLSFDIGKKGADASGTGASTAWREREDAEGAMKAFLSELPSNFALVTGPEGSGKSMMLHRTLEGSRRSLVIDCAELCKAASDAALVTELAKQTGYWPVFSMLASMNNMLDLVSMGLIGQKAGFSTSIQQQMQQVLEVVGKGLKQVSDQRRKEVEGRERRARLDAEVKAQEAVRSELIRRGAWHDGRIDCICGNGIMSELGIGDELMGESDYSPLMDAQPVAVTAEPKALDTAAQEPVKDEKDDVSALPVVVIKNWATKGAKKDELWNVLSEWAAALVENRVAHVVFVSDNTSAPKSLAKALPSKPITTIALTDADASSALAFVTEKLVEAGYKDGLTPDQQTEVQKLGGRLTDLENLVYKVRNGQAVDEAVEEIIARNVAEVRKNAFGDDADDAKNLPWTREQAWSVFRRLAKETEIPYAEVMLDPPFKGNEAALRALEHDEFINISQINGRPADIRAGKPVFYSVFDRLTSDRVFQATQDIAYNSKSIADCESVIYAAETELNTLTNIGINTGKTWIGQNSLAARSDYLLKKIQDSEKKLEQLEAENADLKKVLKGGSKA